LLKELICVAPSRSILSLRGVLAAREKKRKRKKEEKLSLPGAWIQFKRHKGNKSSSQVLFTGTKVYATLKFNTARQSLINRYK